MKFEKTKTEIKERFTRSIDALGENGYEGWKETINKAINKEFKNYPTDQLMFMIQNWAENKNQEIIADPWKELENEKNNK